MSDHPGALRVSDDRRHLVRPDGEPFYFLADTAWSIVWKGMPDEWSRYLDHRRSQGFTVVQVNLLPWRWHMTDVVGNRPFHDDDPDRPNEAYFARFDAFLAAAAERGIYTCLMLIWGGPRPNLPAVNFSIEQAVRFARWAVSRFTRFPMIWSLSGDAEYSQEIAKWEAVGAAVAEADPNDHPTTNHLPPSMNWRFLHHDSAWHDFHMLQTGHTRASATEIAALPAAYFRRLPVKPVVNGEPWYENHPSRDIREVYGPAFTPFEARAAFWMSVLSGATMGHTYGAQGVWNWKRPGDDESEMAGPQVGPPWYDAMHYAGAAQVALGARHLRALPWHRLTPGPERVALEIAPSEQWRVPACATVDETTIVVYVPEANGRFIVRGMAEAAWTGRWLDPRSGAVHALASFTVGITGVWRAPAAPSAEDWVLVLTRREPE
jgi:hypothetical protein